MDHTANAKENIADKHRVNIQDIMVQCPPPKLEATENFKYKYKWWETDFTCTMFVRLK